MDAKDLRTETTLGERSNDGSSKFTHSVAALSCNTNKTYDALPSNHPLGKMETPTSRPCAVIGPDRIVPPPSSLADTYLKKGHYEPWPPVDNTYRQPPEYPHKMPSYLSPLGNISPRQTFQENMPRIMVQPSYNSKVNDDTSYVVDRNLSKNNKINGASESKYCDVPYTINQIGNDQKSNEICAPNVNNARNYPQMWHPASVNMRPARPYCAPDLYQYPEYANCAAGRPVPLTRPHRTINEDPGHVYSDAYYHESNIRFKPYPNIKERYPQTRYEYASNYTNTFHTPHPFPPYKYDMQKPLPPQTPHSQVPIKYVDNRMSDSVLDYQRPPHGPYSTPYRNPVIHPAYGPMIGNNLPNKIYPYGPEGHSKPVPANKLPYDNKLYVDYDAARNKSFPISDSFYDMRPHMKNQVIIPNYPTPNMQPIHPHTYYRKENLTSKNYEYMSHLRHLDPTLNPNAMTKLSSQFSPSSIAISPSDSNTSNDTAHTQGGSLEDCGYVSQSSNASIRSVDSGMNRIMPNEFNRRYHYGYPSHVRASMISKPEVNSNQNQNKKGIDVRQFLQMWKDEGDEENGGNPKEVISQSDFKTTKLPSQYDVPKNHEQLYVLGLTNVPSEELGKYEHIQKVTKLPENIKGYNNIELLKHFEEAFESSNSGHFNHKQNLSRAYPLPPKQPLMQALPPRPLSPLDVEAKISQSVIHKEVGCNFEIRPCSPEMLNVELATPAQNILNERTIEKVTNPLGITPPTLSSSTETENISNVMKQTDHNLLLNENNKIPSCKMINTQYFNNDSTSVVKANYSLQDLEGNAGVCLASLPRLDNDIELNFPEVNQQFINANKETVIITTESGSKSNNVNFDMHDSIENLDDTSKCLVTTELDKEFSKLSKYRKIKRSDGTPKENQFQINSQCLRTDSVIIKNPENTKIIDKTIDRSTYENPSNEKMEEKLQDLTVRQNNGSYTMDDKNESAQVENDIAIDFTLNKLNDLPNNLATDLTEKPQAKKSKKLPSKKRVREGVKAYDFKAELDSKAQSDNKPILLNSTLASEVSSAVINREENLIVENDEKHNSTLQVSENVEHLQMPLNEKDSRESINFDIFTAENHKEYTLDTHDFENNSKTNENDSENPTDSLTLVNSIEKDDVILTDVLSKSPRIDNTKLERQTHETDSEFKGIPTNTLESQTSLESEHSTIQNTVSSLIEYFEDNNDTNCPLPDADSIEIDNTNIPLQIGASSQKNEIFATSSMEIDHPSDLNIDKDTKINESTVELQSENNIIPNSLKSCDNSVSSDNNLNAVTDIPPPSIHYEESGDNNVLDNKLPVSENKILESLVPDHTPENNSHSSMDICNSSLNVSVDFTENNEFAKLEVKKCKESSTVNICDAQTESNSNLLMGVDSVSLDSNGNINLPAETPNEEATNFESYNVSNEIIQTETSSTSNKDDSSSEEIHTNNRSSSMHEAECGQNITLKSLIELDSPRRTDDSDENSNNSSSESETSTASESSDDCDDKTRVENSPFVIHQNLLTDDTVADDSTTTSDFLFKSESTEKTTSEYLVTCESITVTGINTNSAVKIALNSENIENDSHKSVSTTELSSENNTIVEPLDEQDGIAHERNMEIYLTGTKESEENFKTIIQSVDEVISQPIQNINDIENTYTKDIVDTEARTAQNHSIMTLANTLHSINNSHINTTFTNNADQCNDILEKSLNQVTAQDGDFFEIDKDIDSTDRDCTLLDIKQNHERKNYENVTNNHENMDLLSNDPSLDLVHTAQDCGTSLNIDKNNTENSDIQNTNLKSIQDITTIPEIDVMLSNNIDIELNDTTKSNVENIIFEDKSATDALKTDSCVNSEVIDISKKTITVRKRLFCPWIQKLLFRNEDKVFKEFCSESQNNETNQQLKHSFNVSERIQDDFSSLNNSDIVVNEGKYLMLEDHVIEATDIVSSKEELSQTSTGNFCENNHIKSDIDTSSVDHDDIKEIFADISSNDIRIAEDSQTYGIESVTSPLETCLKETESNFTINIPCNVECDEDSIEKSLNLIHGESPPEINKTFSEHTFTQSLKRSLSESALDMYNSDTQDNVPQRSKKFKKNSKNFLNLFNIQNNRRNSISSINDEDNMSFCIVFDETCIIAEEIEEDEKICYNISEECLQPFQGESINEDNIDTTEEIILCPQDDNAQYVQPLVLEMSNDKSFEDSWVDDVACVETVVSDDIAEDVVISASSSIRDVDESDSEDSEMFNDSEHTEKVKYIYGDKMCNDDAELVETLFRTPQMDVNKTLATREPSVNDCFEGQEENPGEIVSNEPHESAFKPEYDSTIEPISENYVINDTAETSDLKTDAHNDSQAFSITETDGIRASFNSTNVSHERTQDLKETPCNDYETASSVDETIKIKSSYSTNSPHVKAQDDNVNSCESSNDDVFSLKNDENFINDGFSSPEVSSTTTEEKNSTILLKITNYKGTRISHLSDVKSHKISGNSCKFTENVNYTSYHSNSTEPRPLITKAAQKYIPPAKDTLVDDLKIKLPLPQHSLMKFKQLKITRNERHSKVVSKNIIPKKPKPRFEDVLKSIDEIQFQKHKEKSKKPKKSIPKVIIKKNENGSHYASTPSKESFNPDLTGRKWQPWVFIEKNMFIDKMAVRKKTKAIYNHRNKTYVFADKFKKYKSIQSAKFVISQPKLDDSSSGQFKYTIRLKHSY